jgi:hypothetical protein
MSALELNVKGHWAAPPKSHQASLTLQPANQPVKNNQSTDMQQAHLEDLK